MDKTLSNFAQLFGLLLVFIFSAQSLTDFVDYYEKLNYQPLQTKRHKRLDSNDIKLRFNAFNRTFNLKLFPLDEFSNVFANDYIVDVDSVELSEQLDLNRFLYNGYVDGEFSSTVYGSLMNGIFDGRITTADGNSFTVEKMTKFSDLFNDNLAYHSLIYADHNIPFKPSKKHRMRRQPLAFNDTNSYGGCALSHEIAKQMLSIQNEERRSRRSLNILDHFRQSTKLPQPEAIPYNKKTNLYSARTCTLYIQVDQYLYQEVFKKEGGRNEFNTRKEIISIVHAHVKSVNEIFESTNFEGITGINFVVQRVSIYTDRSCNKNKKMVTGSRNPFCEENVDVTNYLTILSKNNHAAFCLAYALTFRDFTGGTLGLAWVASKDRATAGGVCFPNLQFKKLAGIQYCHRSLNTGIISLLNYGRRVPMRTSHLTLAHEIGHSFGSPHDEFMECMPGLPDGNFIMFPSATSGDKKNNAKFSPCSLRSISAVLRTILVNPPIDISKTPGVENTKRNCFRVRESAFCGNFIKEKGEQCDCGFSKTECDSLGDKCCQYPEGAPSGRGCKLRVGVRCSPSEGPCCSLQTCDYVDTFQKKVCRLETDCQFNQTCSGMSSECLESRYKPNGTLCGDRTKVCQKGACNGSICVLVGLRDCFLTNTTVSELCHLACVKNGVCQSTLVLPEFRIGKFPQKGRESKPGLVLMPGSPCNNYKGYCDVFRKCRSVDSNGPLAKLRAFILNKKNIDTIAQWVAENQKTCGSIIFGVIVFIILIVRCCAVHTSSSNPKRPKARRFAETFQNPLLLVSPKFALYENWDANHVVATQTNKNMPYINGVVGPRHNRNKDSIDDQEILVRREKRQNFPNMASKENHQSTRQLVFPCKKKAETSEYEQDLERYLSHNPHRLNAQRRMRHGFRKHSKMYNRPDNNFFLPTYPQLNAQDPKAMSPPPKIKDRKVGRRKVIRRKYSSSSTQSS